MGSVSPGWLLVAGTGRMATGAGGLGKSSLDSRRCQALQFEEESFDCLTHNIMSMLYNRIPSVKIKASKKQGESPPPKKRTQFYLVGPKLIGYRGNDYSKGEPSTLY